MPLIRESCPCDECDRIRALCRGMLVGFAIMLAMGGLVLLLIIGLTSV
jgi:hypothetical protein